MFISFYQFIKTRMGLLRYKLNSDRVELTQTDIDKVETELCTRVRELEHMVWESIGKTRDK